MMPAKLSVAIRHQFPGFTLDAAFDAPAGLTALFGQSGSGKTTIVNAVAGLMRPQQGRIEADGLDLTDWLTPEAWQAVRLSLRVSPWAVAASLPLGILIAYALARCRFPGPGLRNGLVNPPLGLPRGVTGQLVLLPFRRRGTVGEVR